MGNVGRPQYITAIVVGLLLLIYATIAWRAVGRKSPTYDEPVEALNSKVIAVTHDYRLQFDNPPLWTYWASILTAGVDVQIDTNTEAWRRLPDDIKRGHRFAVDTLYHTPGQSADALIRRARLMMLLLAVALGALVARWAYQLCGSIAAVATTVFFAFDPNFLAHGALMKNDIALALCVALASYVTWRLGAKRSIAKIIILGLMCGAACAVKLSGILILPIVIVLLGFRQKRWLTDLLSAIVITLICWAVIWASYGFRFSVSPDPSVHINSHAIVADVIKSTGAASEPIRLRLALFALRNRLLPEAWINGLLVIFAATQKRPSFLMGQYSNHSWLWYYPMAMLFKTPIATIIAILSIPLFSLHYRRSKSSLPDRWSAACLAIPPVVYLTMAVATPTAVGLRHILPIYPFLFIAIGCLAVRLCKTMSGKIVVSLVLLGLVLETSFAFPNYIPFFNVVMGGNRGGIDLLSDSNLDWGQDLPLLATWQQEHPDRKLYLAYFGTADPTWFGIRSINLPGGYEFGAPPQLPDGDCVIAVSATTLQGVFATDAVDTRTFYAPFRNRSPMVVLGGSIYLYEYRGEWK